MMNQLLMSVLAQRKRVTPEPQLDWATPIIELNENILSTPIVEGVTMYKVYSNGSYIGYIDSDNVWHGEVSE